MTGGQEKLDQAREDLRKFGASEDDIVEMLGPEVPDVFEVWPENWPAVQAFLVVQTQWATGMGGPTGLDYTRVQSGLGMAGVPLTPDLFDQIRTLEAAALDALSKRAKP